MKTPFSVFFTLILSSQIIAVPGLERTWNKIHPKTEITCTSCHNSTPFSAASNANVTEEGRQKYREILFYRNSNEIAPSKIQPLAQVDFAVLGDSRSDLQINREVLRQIILDEPKIVLHTGDMVANGDIESQWTEVFPLYQPFFEKKNLYHVCGNHEAGHCTRNIVRKALGNDRSFYSVDFQNFTFLALDSNQITAEQIQWLSHLPVGRKYIPFLHHPAYPILSGHSGHEPVVKNFIPQFKRLGVKLVFTGHNHGYDRNEKDGIVYITAGGGGAPLYPCGSFSGAKQACVSNYHYVRCKTEKESIQCQTKLMDGSLVDEVTIDWGKQELTSQKG